MVRAAKGKKLTLEFDAALHEQIEAAATRAGMTVEAFCLDAIRVSVGQSGWGTTGSRLMTPQEAAAELDRLREAIGPIDIPVSELIHEGRAWRP